MIQNEFDFTRSYIVNPMLLLASLDFVQKGKKIATFFPPPFMFYIKTGRYIPLKIDYLQTVKHEIHNFDIDLMKPRVYVWIKSLDFCIPMISHCMIEGFGPVHGQKDPIKVINVCNKDIEKKGLRYLLD